MDTSREALASTDADPTPTAEEVPLGTVAVGVDGSPSADLALAWAIEQAQANGRPLTVVHAVVPEGGVWMDPSGHETRLGMRGLQTHAQHLIAHARETAERRAPGLEVHEVLRVTDPRDLLLALSRRASVLVLGSRGRGPIRSMLLGSVSVAVTRHSSCPVVVLRPSNRGLVRRGVLVGVDGTERSLRPLEFAYRHASQRGLPLTVLHAFQDTVTIAAPHVVVPKVADLEEQALLLAEVVSGLGEKYPDVHVTTELARGPAAQCLVTMAERMDMVVVGSHHGGAASEIMFGSVPASVVEHAKCPVAVVPVAE